jgi:hypothetical protein
LLWFQALDAGLKIGLRKGDRKGVSPTHPEKSQATHSEAMQIGCIA